MLNRCLSLVLVVAATAGLTGAAAFGQDGAGQENPAPVWQLGDITISHAWARATTPHMSAATGYLIIDNAADADRLVAAEAPVSAVVELHEHLHDNGVMRMRQVEGGLDVPANETLDLTPGGLHVMFVGLHAPLQIDQRFPLTLTFEQAGDVTVDVVVRPITALDYSD